MEIKVESELWPELETIYHNMDGFPPSSADLRPAYSAGKIYRTQEGGYQVAGPNYNWVKVGKGPKPEEVLIRVIEGASDAEWLRNIFVRFRTNFSVCATLAKNKNTPWPVLDNLGSMYASFEDPERRLITHNVIHNPSALPETKKRLHDAVAQWEKVDEITVEMQVKGGTSGAKVHEDKPHLRNYGNLKPLDARLQDKIIELFREAGFDAVIPRESGLLQHLQDKHDAPLGFRRHTNGGGLVAITATVEPTVYVAEDAVVNGEAKVAGYCRIEGDAQVKGSAELWGSVIVREHATVSGNARVSGHSIIEEKATVEGNAVIKDEARIRGRSHIFENAEVKGKALVEDSKVFGEAVVRDEAVLCGHGSSFVQVSRRALVRDRATVKGAAQVKGSAVVKDYAEISESAILDGSVTVEDHAKVQGDAICSGSSKVQGHALIREKAWVTDNAVVSGNAHVMGTTAIKGDSRVQDNTVITGAAKIYGEALVGHDATVGGKAHVRGGQVLGHASVNGSAVVAGDPEISGYATVEGRAEVLDDALIADDAKVYGNATVAGQAKIYGDAEVFGNAKLTESVVVRGESKISDSKTYAGTAVHKDVVFEESPPLEYLKNALVEIKDRPSLMDVAKAAAVNALAKKASDALLGQLPDPAKAVAGALAAPVAAGALVKDPYLAKDMRSLGVEKVVHDAVEGFMSKGGKQK